MNSKKLAFNPRVLGGCDHTFCLSCSNLQFGKPCTICGILSEPNMCRPDLKIESLLKAYIPMANFLGIDVTKTYENDAVNNNGFSDKFVSVTLSVATRSSSLNESLNSSISGTPASKLNKRNQKGETQLHVVSVYL